MVYMKRLKWLIYLLSFFMTINFTTPVFASFCQLKYGLNSAQITGLFAVYSLSVFLLEIPTGILSDKVGENKSLIIGAAFTAIAMFLFIEGTTVLLYVGEFVLGLGSTFFSGPFDSIIYKYCKDSKNNLDFDEVVSKSYSLQWIALCFSFLGCFVIMKKGELVHVFWITFVSNIILLIIACLLPSISAEVKNNTNDIVKKYFFEIISNRKLLLICLLNVCFSMILVTGYQILQTYLLSSSVSNKYNGVLYFIAAVFASSGAYFYKKLKSIFKFEKILISVCLALLAVCMFGLGLISRVLLIFVFICIYRLVWGITSPMFSSLVNQNIEDDSFRNTAFSIISLGCNLGSSVLLFLFSTINMSAEQEYIILGILCLGLCGVFSWNRFTNKCNGERH